MLKATPFALLLLRVSHFCLSEFPSQNSPGAILFIPDHFLQPVLWPLTSLFCLDTHPKTQPPTQTNTPPKNQKTHQKQPPRNPPHNPKKRHTPSVILSSGEGSVAYFPLVIFRSFPTPLSLPTFFFILTVLLGSLRIVRFGCFLSSIPLLPSAPSPVHLLRNRFVRRSEFPEPCLRRLELFVTTTRVFPAFSSFSLCALFSFTLGFLLFFLTARHVRCFQAITCPSTLVHVKSVEVCFFLTTFPWVSIVPG